MDYKNFDINEYISHSLRQVISHDMVFELKCKL